MIKHLFVLLLGFISVSVTAQVKKGYVDYYKAMAYFPIAVERELAFGRFFKPKTDSLSLMNSQLDSVMHYHAYDTASIDSDGMVLSQADVFQQAIEDLYAELRDEMWQRRTLKDELNHRDLVEFLNVFASDGDCIMLISERSMKYCFQCTDYTSAFIEFVHELDPARADSTEMFMHDPVYR